MRKSLDIINQVMGSETKEGIKMSTDQCPHCGGYCLPPLRRSFLGPLTSAPCRSCGERVSVPGWSVFTVAPIIIAVAVVPNYTTDPHLVAMSAVLLSMLTSLLNDTFVPLVKSKN